VGAELGGADLKRHPGARRGPLEEQGDGLARKRLRALALVTSGLQGERSVEQRLELLAR